MAFVEPITLSARGVELVPLALAHEAGLRTAAADGELWNIRVTSVALRHFPTARRHFRVTLRHFPVALRHFPMIRWHFPAVRRHFRVALGPLHAPRGRSRAARRHSRKRPRDPQVQSEPDGIPLCAKPILNLLAVQSPAL